MKSAVRGGGVGFANADDTVIVSVCPSVKLLTRVIRKSDTLQVTSVTKCYTCKIEDQWFVIYSHIEGAKVRRGARNSCESFPEPRFVRTGYN